MNHAIERECLLSIADGLVDWLHNNLWNPRVSDYQWAECKASLEYLRIRRMRCPRTTSGVAVLA